MKRKLRSILLLLLVAPSLALAGAENFRVVPPNPESGDQVSLVFDVFWPEFSGLDGGPRSSSASVTGSVIHVTAVVGAAPDIDPRPPPLPRFQVAVPLGTLRPGDYVVDYAIDTFSFGRTGPLASGTLGFTVVPRPIPASGVWGLVVLGIGILTLARLRRTAHAP